jgi:ribosome-associated protein
MIWITRHLAIPEGELQLSASRSSGPGGQSVNKVASRVTLYFDVRSSPSLSADQKRRILSRLRNRISKSGVLQVTSQATRSQSMNRERAIRRFAELVADALRVSPPRRRTSVPPAAKERRLREKKRRSRLKRERARGLEEG